MLAGGECAYEREPIKASWPLCGIYTTTLRRWYSGYHGFQLKVAKLVLAELPASMQPITCGADGQEARMP
jgi:hypothetical protein